VKYKLYKNVEKWILRKALGNSLPDKIARRPKAKFWEGAGTREIISSHAERQISDSDFKRERYLANGMIINTKEELYYYRIFKDHFGSDIDISWMGRTSKWGLAGSSERTTIPR
jgi:asparagine synthase (glutamine-hydrolysing)